MKKTFCLSLAIIALLAITLLSACGHEHTFSDEWSQDGENHYHVCTVDDCAEISDKAEHTFVLKVDGTNHWQECSVCGYKKDSAEHTYVTKKDETNHWQECSCGYKKDEAVHTYVTKHNDTKHWSECSCGYKKDEIAHAYTTKFDDKKHWSECSCGYKKDEAAHDIVVAEINVANHKLKCNVCDYVSGELDHTYEEDDQITCDVCSHDRDQATLAFKAGTDTFTYDGTAQVFDKENLVNVSGAELSEVVVEYSVKKDNPVWTAEAPVNAGTYYIRLSVPATKDHTSAQATKELKITTKTIALTNFSRVYTLAEANRNSWTENVTSADIDGILATDTLQFMFAKNSEKSITEGTSYDLKWYSVAQEGADGDEFALVRVGNSNYTIDSSTTGKIYITNSLTASEGETTYSAEATIKKGDFAYYSLTMDRTSSTVNFDVTLSNGNAKIVDVYSKLTWLTATLASDGTLVTYGAEGNFTFYVVVKYEGTEDSITNTLTLTKNDDATTVADDTAWGNAINVDKVDRLHVVLKEDGNVIEESKTDKDNRSYYKNDNGIEVYYRIVASKYYFYRYSKNSAGKWVKELAFTEATSLNESNTSAYNATKFSSALLNALTLKSEFTFSDTDQMYHLASKEVSDITYTDVALKFRAGKLVYAEYKLDGKLYTIEFVYGTPTIETPGAEMGTSQENAFELEYTTGDSNKFLLENVSLLNGENWFVIDITEDIFNANKKISENCEIDGSFTSSITVDGLTMEIKLFNSSNEEQTNSKATDSGKLDVSGLTVGKYYVKVTVNNDCIGSWNIGFNKGNVIGGL